MSLTYTITGVSPEFNDWAGNANTGPIRYFKFQFRDSDGGMGEGSFGRKINNGHAEPPAVGYEFVAKSAEFNEQHGNWKFKGVQSPEQAAKYGSESSGSTGGFGAADNNDKMRSKEQCIRGEAIIAAANLAKSAEEAMSYAPKFEAWITNGSPAQAAPTSTWSSDAPPVASDEQIPF